MPCKRCKSEPVIQSRINATELCKNCFSRYLESKVKKTISKYHLLEKEDAILIEGCPALIYILTNMAKKQRKFHIVKRSKKIARDANLDDNANKILKCQFEGRDAASEVGPLLREKQKIIINPLFFCTRDEIELFQKLKRLGKLKKRKENEIAILLDEFENKHPGTKYAIINSFLEMTAKFGIKLRK